MVVWRDDAVLDPQQSTRRLREIADEEHPAPNKGVFFVFSTMFEAWCCTWETASPDALARALGDLIGTDGVRIAVTNQSLDGRVGILEIVRRERFEYRIGPDGALTGGLVPAGGGEP